MYRAMIPILLAALSWPQAGAAAPPGEATDTRVLESTRATLAKWVETQQVISREKKDWVLGKEVLERRISLLEDEIAGLEEKSRETRKAVRETDGKRRDLVDERESLKRASASLAC